MISNIPVELCEVKMSKCDSMNTPRAWKYGEFPIGKQTIISKTTGPSHTHECSTK